MSLGLLILRLVVGLSLAAHGTQKLFGWFGGYGLKGTGQFLEQLGFRPGRLQALQAGLAETLGGLFLAAGFLTPAAAAAVVAVMLVAAVSVHLKNGFFAPGRRLRVHAGAGRSGRGAGLHRTRRHFRGPCARNPALRRAVGPGCTGRRRARRRGPAPRPQAAAETAAAKSAA